MAFKANIQLNGRDLELYSADIRAPSGVTPIRYLNQQDWSELAGAICASPDPALSSLFGASNGKPLEPDAVIAAIQEGRVQLVSPTATSNDLPMRLFPFLETKKESPQNLSFTSTKPAPEKPKGIPTKQDLYLVLEVAGHDLGNRQRVLLYETADQKSKDQAPARDGDHRSLVVFSELAPGAYEIGLKISMSDGASALTLPLVKGVSPSKVKQKNEEWDHVLVPIKPVRYVDETCDKAKIDLPSGGWLYVFWKNKLWRELEVKDNTAFRDVRLDYYRNTTRSKGATSPESSRSADGFWLNEIWVPYKLSGTYQTGNNGVRIAYSRNQWHWDWVEKLESDPNALKQESVALEELQSYSKSRTFESSGAVDSLKVAMSRTQGLAKRLLSGNKAKNIAVVYLPPAPVNDLTVEFEVGAANTSGETLVLLHHESPWQQKKIAKPGRNEFWREVAFDTVPKSGTFSLLRLRNGGEPVVMYHKRKLDELRKKETESADA